MHYKANSYTDENTKIHGAYSVLSTVLCNYSLLLRSQNLLSEKGKGVLYQSYLPEQSNQITVLVTGIKD